jgi:endonuclease/exonuclease/phosphatase (EEP) superfamily protein YafD
VLAGVALIELLALEIATRSVMLLTITLGCLAWQVSRIWRYTPISPKQVKQIEQAEQTDLASSICVLIANVLQSNRKYEGLLAQIEAKDPDIVLTVETDRWWMERLLPLKERYPFTVLHPLDNTYGMLLFSKLELSDIKLQDRVTPNIPSIFARVKMRSGKTIDLFCVHPEPPQIDNDVEERDAELLLVAKEVARSKRPAIVCGDLNDVAWSHTTKLFQRISGLLDPRVGRGIYPTFHAGHWFARWPLDHVFHHSSFRLRNLQVLDNFGSDHFPVLVSLHQDATAVWEQEAPLPEPEDRVEAEQKITEGRTAVASWCRLTRTGK